MKKVFSIVLILLILNLFFNCQNPSEILSSYEEEENEELSDDTNTKKPGKGGSTGGSGKTVFHKPQVFVFCQFLSCTDNSFVV
jgi:hypothetical protein